MFFKKEEIKIVCIKVISSIELSMVDEKIAALAAEYEKARKQNIQLREALKAKDRYNAVNQVLK